MSSDRQLRKRHRNHHQRQKHHNYNPTIVTSSSSSKHGRFYYRLCLILTIIVITIILAITIIISSSVLVNCLLPLIQHTDKSSTSQSTDESLCNVKLHPNKTYIQTEFTSTFKQRVSIHKNFSSNLLTKSGELINFSKEKPLEMLVMHSYLKWRLVHSKLR